MASHIRNFDYCKARGRGRGILGLKEFNPDRKPGRSEQASSFDSNSKPSGKNAEPKSAPAKLVVATYSYEADPNSHGGFKELSLQKGQMLEFVGEHPDNEHWWEVKNEDGEQGFAPSSRLLIKEEQGLPWLQATALKAEEEERKQRVSRLAQQKAALEGKGFGPTPKDPQNLPPKPYVSSYGRESQGSESFYCKVCEKQLNGPKPYQAHMASKAHKEELALLES